MLGGPHGGHRPCRPPPRPQNLPPPRNTAPHTGGGVVRVFRVPLCALPIRATVTLADSEPNG
jgi:hypothetical protein